MTSSVVSGAFRNQIENRNFLAPVGFKFTLSKYPKVSFFSNTARIPDISLGTAIESNQIKPVIHEVLDISETEKAHQIMEDNQNIGKLVLSLGG